MGGAEADYDRDNGGGAWGASLDHERNDTPQADNGRKRDPTDIADTVTKDGTE